jgi:hypothetical protein
VKNELARASAMGKMRGTLRFLVGKPEGKDNLENLGVDGRIVLKSFKDIGWDGVDWIDVAQNGKRWRVFVNKVMDLGF